MSDCEHQWYPVAGNRLCCVKCAETCSPVDELFGVLHGPMRGEVGYTGDIIELLEYPCNCEYCRGEWQPKKRERHESA